MNEALRIAIAAVENKKGIDIVVLDISSVATFADYFVLCTGDSSRQIQAIADEVEEKLAANGLKPSHVEGYANAEWILLDYLDLVIHVFSKQARAYYDLERLWRDAKTLDVRQLLSQPEKETVTAPRARRRRT